MIITIPPWEVLVDRFGEDSDGDVGTTNDYYFKASDYDLLPANRELRISDDADIDYDHAIFNPTLTKHFIPKVFVDFCIEYAAKTVYGKSKYLGSVK